MIYKNMLLGSVTVVVLLGLVGSSVSAYYHGTTTSETTEAADEKMSYQDSVDQFLGLLAAVDLETDLLSEDADMLARSFAEAATAIQELEEVGKYEQAQKYRDDIQKAIDNHMERDGAWDAAISKNIDTYSRYLTETLIAQASY